MPSCGWRCSSCLLPLLHILASSFSSPTAVASGSVFLWPVEPSLKGYTVVFSSRRIGTGFLNSFIYSTVGTAINIVMTVIAAYPLSRRDFFGRNLFMFAFTFTMIFYGGLIPTYLVVRALGMVNTRLAMVIPNAMVVFYVIIARTYFQSTLPSELREAAEIDGCDDFTFVWRVVLPLSRPIVAVLALMYAVNHWNAFFNALIYLFTPGLFPLQIVLRDILVAGNFDLSHMRNIRVVDMIERQFLVNLLRFSLIVVASFPVLVLYPFVQRHFVKGVMIGALKG